MHATAKKPFVGLGLKHGRGEAPNMAALEWAKGRLGQLREQGYLRVVLERDPAGQPVPYFNKLATDARGMGFAVVMEPEVGVRRHKDVYDRIEAMEMEKKRNPRDTPELNAAIEHLEKEKDVEHGARSESMGRLTLDEEGSVLVGGGSHVMHVEEFVAPQQGAAFLPEYHTPFEEWQKARIRGIWMNYQTAGRPKAGL